MLNEFPYLPLYALMMFCWFTIVGFRTHELEFGTSEIDLPYLESGCHVNCLLSCGALDRCPGFH